MFKRFWTIFSLGAPDWPDRAIATKKKKKKKKKKFLEVSRCSREKQRQEMYKKSVLRVQSCFFAN